jgi:hypothetical protein
MVLPDRRFVNLYTSILPLCYERDLLGLYTNTYALLKINSFGCDDHEKTGITENTDLDLAIYFLLTKTCQKYCRYRVLSKSSSMHQPLYRDAQKVQVPSPV